ncbi:hypothetical protein Ndes2526B_g08102 [Nannochloris sp. 'desiccata']|nr:hypothetical protein KSW81_002737 [Chlorella desiccata (nom. nud.)]KAH7617494.1 hypothetical protein NADE_007272 [Chlorella desiccata (nom. nud.)]
MAMFDTVYNAVGAATGTVKGVAEVGKKEAKATASSLSSHVLATLSHLQAAVTARARNTTSKLYSVAGALSGLVNGVKYAGLSIWWWATDDEIKIKLLQGSPVKYKLRDLESLLHTHTPSMGGLPTQGQYNNGNGVPPDAEVSLGAPVINSNDHLAAQNQEERRRQSEDFSNSVDESIVNKAASNSLKSSNSKTTSASRHHNKNKKKGVPSTPQQQEEYSPRVLA